MKGIDILRANFARRQELQTELRGIDEKAVDEKRAYTEDEAGRASELRDALAQVDEKVKADLELESRNAEIEHGLAGLLGTLSARDGDVVDERTLGQQFVENEAIAAWMERSGGRGTSPSVDFPGVDLRAVTDTTLGATSAGALTRPDRLARTPQAFIDRKVFLVDRLPHIATSQASVEYPIDNSPLADLADKAAEVAEGSAKPQAGVTLAVVTEPIRTVAAWANITRQALADVPQIQSFLDGRLRYSLKRRLDKQVIAGDGTAPNISGILDRTTLTYAPGAAEARYQSIRHAIAVMENAETVPEIVVLNPSDAEAFDLSNHGGDGLHAVPNLAGPGAPTAWGLEQVHSTAVTAGTALLIDPMGLAVLDRQSPTAYFTDSHASNFTSNILTLLLELRAGLALFDSASVCAVTFNGTA